MAVHGMSEYSVNIEPAEDGTGFGAFVPGLPGCIASAYSEKAQGANRTLAPLHIQSLRAYGEPVPPPAVRAERIIARGPISWLISERRLRAAMATAARRS